MLIVDAHLDLAWNAVQGGRDLRRPVAEIRRTEAEAGLEGPGRGQGTVALPELRLGHVGVAVATLIARCTGTPLEGVDYATVAEATAVARGQLAYYRELEQEGLVVVLENAGALREHVAHWERWDESDPVPPIGLVVSLEGADPIATPADVDEWYAAGVRIIGLSHYGPGRYAGGTMTDGGLTADGPALLAAMARCGIALDVTHSTDAGMAESLVLFDGPVLASHSNARALVPHQRQLTDAQLTELARRDGVIGSVFDCWMLDPTWMRGQKENPVTLERVADQIEHVCQVTGGTEHAAIGSDLDGGFGREQSPGDLDTIADLPRLGGILRERGYSEGDVAAVLHGNWLRLLERILG